MGILNLTPDSFSGDGLKSVDKALTQAEQMRSAGALILDIGGESTRPGAVPVPAREELGRVMPVVEALAGSDVVISVDTYKPEVAAAVLDAGAHLVNDVSGLRDPEMLKVCAERGAPAVIMHMQGTPLTMQASPQYEDVVAEVAAYLNRQADEALAAGLPGVLLDPGFGFGKTLAHNLSLVKGLKRLTDGPHPVVLGASRKGTVGKLTDVAEAAQRDPGSLALHLYAAARGASLLRVHNVEMHAQALQVWRALEDYGDDGG